MIGIYKIENKINKKCYIGKSINIKLRWSKGHINPLNDSVHVNNHLQNAWNKYGQNNFEFSIIEECKEELLNEREIYWIEYYKSSDPNFGYNKTKGGDGVCFTDEIREKHKASLNTKEYLTFASNHSKKLWSDPEFKEKMVNNIRKFSSTDEFEEIVKDSISDAMSNFGPKGLAEYLDEKYQPYADKIDSITVAVENGYAITTVIANQILNEDELDNLQDYISGQFSDGWGEGLEQVTIDSWTDTYPEEIEEDGEVYQEDVEYETTLSVSLWDHKDWKLTQL